MEFKWRSLEKDKPVCVMTGDFEGRKCEGLLVQVQDGSYHVVECHMTLFQGNFEYDFYDREDFYIPDVKYWAKIPSIVNTEL